MKPLPLLLLLTASGFATARQFDRDQAPPALLPAESRRAFTVPDDLEVDLVLSEPLVAQPLHLSFDARGRLWLAEYRQYPAPAGLKQVSHDKFWRSVYDRVPPAPPNHFRGKDRISIHEDTNGDGSFDLHKVFVDGLNIATAAACGDDGVWVMNPPYLLFYPDRDGDDVPDGAPEVHLSGFGLEDTHSVANSLRFGPDGWLYACQGSTVSGHIRVEPLPTDPSPVSPRVIHTLGQNIWRYHPATRRYEVFAEGGGNAFGIEIDSAGRLFSGHNGGDTRGFHYVQGGYLMKGFQKHGALSNPFAFGFFPQMKSNRVERFTHTFLVYEDDALPGRYHGKLFGLESLQGRVVLADITPSGSTFETRDIAHAVTTTDRWFRPVDIKSGPDGAIYIADWHDFSINHWRNYQGNMDASGGRVWRLRAKDHQFAGPADFTKLSSDQLLAHLSSPIRWIRETAVRQLAARGDAGVLPRLEAMLEAPTGAGTLPAFQAWHQVSGPHAPRDRFLQHPSWQVRQWAVRFLGDPFPGQLDTGGLGSIPATNLNKLVELAEKDPNIEVRAQLAATARRLPAQAAIPVIRALALRHEDAGDSRQPLAIWWALEAKTAGHSDEILDVFRDPSLWDAPVVRDHLLERLMRRHAQAGSPSDLLACAELFTLSPSEAHSKILMRGFEAAYEGRAMTGLPDELIKAMSRHDAGSITVGLRRGDPEARQKALLLIGNRQADADQRQRIVQILGEIKDDRSVPVLLQLADEETNDAVLQAVFAALQPFNADRTAATTIRRLPGLAPAPRTAALTLLTSRPGLAEALVAAVDQGRVPAGSVAPEFARKLKPLVPADQLATINRLWPNAGRPTSKQMDTEISRLRTALADGHGDPYRGRELYDLSCAACHRLFTRGGDIGPDLTSFDRRDPDTLLLAIVNPGAEIREGYENFLIQTRDQRTLGGFIVAQDQRRLILRGFDGQNLVLQRDTIASINAAGTSLMPEGLTNALDDQQVRDLFAYLRSSQPLNQ